MPVFWRNFRSQIWFRLFKLKLTSVITIDQKWNTSEAKNDLKRLERWQDDCQSFNPNKCVTMTIGSRNPPQHIYNFCKQQLESVLSHPYLGVCFNNTLTWHDHIQQTSKKAQCMLGLIRRNLWMCTKEIKSSAYTTLIRPLLEYSSSV